MPEQSGRTVRNRIPPVVIPLLTDPAASRRLPAGIAAMTANATAPFVTDSATKMATTLAGASLRADPAASRRLQDRIAAMLAQVTAPFVKDFQATMASSFTNLVPSVPVIPLSVLRPPVVTSNAALANRIEDALDRNTAFVVSTMASSVGPVRSPQATLTPM